MLWFLASWWKWHKKANFRFRVLPYLFDHMCNIKGESFFFATLMQTVLLHSWWRLLEVGPSCASSLRAVRLGSLQEPLTEVRWRPPRQWLPQEVANKYNVNAWHTPTLTASKFCCACAQDPESTNAPKTVFWQTCRKLRDSQKWNVHHTTLSTLSSTWFGCNAFGLIPAKIAQATSRQKWKLCRGHNCRNWANGTFLSFISYKLKAACKQSSNITQCLCLLLS